MTTDKPFIRAIRQKSALHTLTAAAMDTFADTVTKHWPETYHGSSRADVVELQKNCVDLDVYVASHMFELRIKQVPSDSRVKGAQPAERGEVTEMEFCYCLQDDFTVSNTTIDNLKRYIRKETINYIKKERYRQRRTYEEYGEV